MTPTDKTRDADFPRRTDVLVVGAGPTGLSLASGLARLGIDHVLIDHAPQVAANSQSAVVDARTLETLETIDAARPLVLRGVSVRHFTLRDRDDELLRLDFSELPTRYPYMLMVPESIAESVLSERLASYGSSVLRPVTAVALQQDAGGVTVELWDGSTSRWGSPSRRSILARYVVGCDGMHSQIRSALEIPFVGSSRIESFVMADVRLLGTLPRSEVQLFLSGDGLLLVAPLPDDRYRILATVDRVIEYPALDDLQALLRTRGPQASPAVVRDAIWSTSLRVHHRLATHYRSGRVFLAGDAAHLHSPVGGQGMNAGIQDALHLAAKLADVLAGRADDAVLDQYEDERRPVAEGVHRLTHRMSGVATLRDRRAARIRNQFLRALGLLPVFRRELTGRLSGLEWVKRSRGEARESKLLRAATLILVAFLVATSFHALSTYVGGPIESVALFSSGWLAARQRRRSRGFVASLAAAACLLVAFGIWFVLLRPVHAEIASLAASSDPSRSVAVQSRWELSHWGRMLLHLCSFVLLASAPR
jgi:2-polyprenyl-6-methoxyphenol hydroxylase-like FAD-dependent oxidoreductase